MADRFDPEDIATLLHALADASAEAALEHFRTRIDVADKAAAVGAFDPVTEADRNAEAAIRALIAQARPDDTVFGEEMADTEGSSGFRWVIDPIDGTRAYISGLPTWGTIIGLERDGEAIAGMFNQPFTRERYWASGGRAWHMLGNGEPQAIRTSQVTALADATLMTTSPRMFGADDAARYDRVEMAARLARYGCDGYAYCMLAAGHIDLIAEADLMPYDICGIVPIIEAAGGVITDWEGGPAHGGGRALAAATAELHVAALAMLERGGPPTPPYPG